MKDELRKKIAGARDTVSLIRSVGGDHSRLSRVINQMTRELDYPLWDVFYMAGGSSRKVRFAAKDKQHAIAIAKDRGYDVTGLAVKVNESARRASRATKLVDKLLACG